MAKRPRILFLHPEPAAYRRRFFSLLNEHFDITFVFTGGHHWVQNLPEATTWKYKERRPFRVPPYQSDVAPGVVFEAMRGYDIIVGSIITSFPVHAVFPIAHLLRKKFVTFDELWSWPNTPAARLALPYARYIARHAALNFVAGSQSKRFFLDQFGVPEKQIVICPNSAENVSQIPIDTGLREHLIEKYSLKGKKVILYLSRIIRLRNLDGLLHAYAKIERTHPDTVLLIGGTGDFEPACRQLAERLHIRSAYFLGKIPHRAVPTYYDLCDLFVLPGRFLPHDMVHVESWGLVLNEVMTFGKPIVSTESVGAAYDLIRPGVNGYRVPADDPSSLGYAITSILDNPELRESMGRASTQIISQFTAEIQFDVVASALQRLSESGPTR